MLPTTIPYQPPLLLPGAAPPLAPPRVPPPPPALLCFWLQNAKEGCHPAQQQTAGNVSTPHTKESTKRPKGRVLLPDPPL